jgi:toxin ParE1/3/4
MREDIGQGYRSYREGSHLVFYVVERGIVIIIGVPHGSMDIDAFFQSPT